MDTVNSVDGKRIRGGQDVVRLAETKPVGTPILFDITSKGQTRSTVLPVQDFSLGDFLLIFIVPFIGGMIFYTLGFVVYLLKPNTRTSWVFFFSSLIIGFYTVSGFEIQSTYYFANLHYFIIPFYAGLPLSYRFYLPREKTNLNPLSLAGVSDISARSVFGCGLSIVPVYLFLGQPACLDTSHLPSD